MYKDVRGNVIEAGCVICSIFDIDQRVKFNVGISDRKLAIRNEEDRGEIMYLEDLMTETYVIVSNPRQEIAKLVEDLSQYKQIGMILDNGKSTKIVQLGIEERHVASFLEAFFDVE